MGVITMTDKQITSNDYIFELNEMCIDCISEIDECECRKIAENLHFKLYRKEQESEKLKAENDELKKEINNKYSVSNFNVIFMREHIHNLKQTLAEIKEIAEKHAPRCNDNANCDYECEECHLSDLKQILRKISEVDNGIQARRV
jgi:predicted RNase H-like nuclease (RuvC/YqgF family)